MEEFVVSIWVLSSLRSPARDIPNESGLMIDTHLGFVVGECQEQQLGLS